MGAQWKHAGRVSGAAKRGAMVGKLVKEITVAGKVGDPNPDNNPRLRVAMDAARKASVPRDTIDRALKKAQGLLDDQATIETVVYEGYTPHQVPVIVECLTDNKNRTAADVRVLFRKGQVATVNYLFDRMGQIEAHHTDSRLDLDTVGIELGAENVEPVTGGDVPAGCKGARFFTSIADLINITKALQASGWEITQSELGYVAKNPLEVPADQMADISAFLGDLDDHDDVHRIYVALKT